jgi:hypothetical protein
VHTHVHCIFVFNDVVTELDNWLGSPVVYHVVILFNICP